MRSSSDPLRPAVRATCLLAATVVLAGCGSGGGSDTDPASAPTTSVAVQPGPFVGECGSLTDAEVYERARIAGLTPVSRNGIKCRWEADGGERYVMFTWYRGSPIDRERSVAKGIGHEVHDLEIAGHRGFSSQNVGFCEVALGTGSDFVHWLVRYGTGSAPSDPCEAPTALGRLTLEKAK
ncbi:DUF3558 domain-containing protein [Rhodococcus sp. ACS1]|uniref:DUF3558 domain-containing protein n=1 Tax=Rhodococcus koreensis TaxID=99653 RepID=A0A1H4ZW72_9NOCA|nr:MULTISPECIES: DUF3558 domain-containing protein [Rhodococcus]PBC36238.1 DUF3558 domain-containing protein [Rhodococcus sp. ACS1]QSE79120.1 DUF3558 domain-containing protein [Rhodococcus koreensis]SED34456.1 Protein of unknown function [Rhodococcus koreensis]